MQSESIPDWVPDAVKNVAIGSGIENDRLRRFVSDLRMKSVWRYLLGRKVNEGGIDAVPLSEMLTACDVKPFWFDVQQRACAAVYLAVLETTVAGDHAITRSMLEASGRRYTETRDSCRWLAEGGLFPIIPVKNEIKEALNSIERYCEDQYRFLIQDKNPRRLDISSGSRNEDWLRGHIRKIAVSIRALYGLTLAGQLTTIANVVFVPAKQVDVKTVRNWCAKLPSQTAE